MALNQVQGADMDNLNEAAAPRGYEFDGGQNSIFRSLAQQMNFVAYVTILLGVLSGLGALTGDWLSAVIGLVYVLIGVWTLGASRSFRKIVHTEGSDINHLMSAMTDLTKLYTLTKWALIIALVGGFIAGWMAGMEEVAAE